MARLTAAENDVYERIRSAIADRQLLPGQRLREVELCRIFATTRGTIRKVLARLAYDGLVDHQANRGASVAQPSPKDATDLFSARHCIELAVAKAAAERMTPATLRRLQRHIERERSAESQGNRQKMITLSGEFHLLLSQIADNSVFTRFLAELIARESLIIQLYEKPDQANCSHEEHAEIVEALVASDPERLEAAVRSHIDGIAQSLDLDLSDRARPSLDEVFSRK